MLKHLQTRREFLRSGAKGAALVAAASFVPEFLSQSVWAQEGVQGWTQNSSGRILVVIQLAGGNDGLNVLVPFDDDAYFRLRPKLAHKAETVLKLSDHYGLHPSAVAFKKLYDEGMFAAVHGVGYPNPNRSHFRSMDIWHGGIDPKLNTDTGWIGRYFDAQCGGKDPVASTIGVNVGKVFPNAFRNVHSLGASLEDPDAYRWEPSGKSKMLTEVQQKIFKDLNSPQMDADPSLTFLQHTGMNAYLSADQIHSAVKRYQSKVYYPNSALGNSMQLIAQLLAGGLETRVFYAHQGGYDTHSKQAGSHAKLLEDLSESCASFQQDLEALGLAERVTTMMFSEFGRRVAENASGGTDHGAAAPVFLVGKKIKAGLHGTAPSLTDLVDGDLKFSSDFRQVYATVLDQWLGASSKGILGNEFKQLGLFKS